MLNAVLSQGSECSLLTKEKQGELLVSVAQRWHLNAAELHLSDARPVHDSCYWRVVLTSRTLAQPWTLFISPDFRFVFGSMIDTLVSPEIEAREEAQANAELLLTDRSPMRGPLTAPITLVEFVDFACPYCKRFNAWLSDLQKRGLSMRVVFKYLPLARHPWALYAARVANCAGSDSESRFWEMHDFFFEAQEQLTAENIHERVSKELMATNNLGAHQVLECAAAENSRATIERDRSLAERLHVIHTPTVFINGYRVENLGSEEDLRNAISARATAKQANKVTAGIREKVTSASSLH